MSNKSKMVQRISFDKTREYDETTGEWLIVDWEKVKETPEWAWLQYTVTHAVNKYFRLSKLSFDENTKFYFEFYLDGGQRVMDTFEIKGDYSWLMDGVKYRIKCSEFGLLHLQSEPDVWHPKIDEKEWHPKSWSRILGTNEEYALDEDNREREDDYTECPD